jgi:hypothetical protein
VYEKGVEDGKSLDIKTVMIQTDKPLDNVEV